MRKLEKITLDQFKNDIKDDNTLYNEYLVPSRSTKNSAGYDFKSIMDFELLPGEIKKIATGIKASMNNDEVLFLIVRSSMGFKYNVRMCNQVGVIDSDYYNNTNNEGHIWVALKNEGDKPYIVKKNEAFVQGIFMKYLITEGEEEIKLERNGGFGSTNKEE